MTTRELHDTERSSAEEPRLSHERTREQLRLATFEDSPLGSLARVIAGLEERVGKLEWRESRRRLDEQAVEVREARERAMAAGSPAADKDDEPANLPAEEPKAELRWSAIRIVPRHALLGFRSDEWHLRRDDELLCIPTLGIVWSWLDGRPEGKATACGDCVAEALRRCLPIPPLPGEPQAEPSSGVDVVIKTDTSLVEPPEAKTRRETALQIMDAIDGMAEDHGRSGKECVMVEALRETLDRMFPGWASAQPLGGRRGNPPPLPEKEGER